MRLSLIHFLVALMIAAFSLGAEPALAQSMPGCGGSEMNHDPCDKGGADCLPMLGCAGQVQRMPMQGMDVPTPDVRVLAFAMPARDSNETTCVTPEIAPPRG